MVQSSKYYIYHCVRNQQMFTLKQLISSQYLIFNRTTFPHLVGKLKTDELELDSTESEEQTYHLLLFVVELLLLVHQVLFEVGQHFHRDVHLSRELSGLVFQILLLLT